MDDEDIAMIDLTKIDESDAYQHRLKCQLIMGYAFGMRGSKDQSSLRINLIMR